MIGLNHYLIFSAILFTLGLYGVLTKRNAIALLMSLELLFNGVTVSVVAVARYTTPLNLDGGSVESLLTGQIFAMFIICIAAAEIALGLAIVILLYRGQATVDVGEASLMRR